MDMDHIVTIKLRNHSNHTYTYISGSKQQVPLKVPDEWLEIKNGLVKTYQIYMAFITVEHYKEGDLLSTNVNFTIIPS